jgi:hypothetical protein
MVYALWIIQGLLAALFLFAGVVKLVLPAEVLAAGTTLPVAFLRFIAVAEVLGALGLILPAALRIRPGLTPLAALGLTMIMIGATTTVLVGPMPETVPIPIISGLLSAFVAYGRWKILPIRPR